MALLSLRSGAIAGAVASAMLLSCSGHTTDGGSGGALPCDVDRVLATQCRDCHTSPPLHGAPMPLVTYDDLHAKAFTAPDKKVYEVVGARTHDAVHPMPDPPRARLSAGDQSTLDRWIAAGAPSAPTHCAASDPDAGRDASPSPDLPPGCPNVTLRADAPYVMDATTGDEYVCFGVDVAVPKKHHVVRFDPKIDNAVIAHHAIVYVSSSAESATPHRCSPASTFGRQLIYAWAPGGAAFDVPNEAGLPIEGTTHFVVQMHYSNLRHLSGQQDQSSIELCATDTLRANDADVLAFGAEQFSIPPRKTYELDCTVDVPANFPPVHFFRSMPHMHQIGHTIGTSIAHAGGAPVTLDEVTSWSFGSQPWNAVDATLSAGDHVRTWCSWQNGGDAPVTWGPETSDEMCYHFLMYYPRITAPGWAWQAPIRLESCAPAN